MSGIEPMDADYLYNLSGDETDLVSNMRSYVSLPEITALKGPRTAAPPPNFPARASAAGANVCHRYDDNESVASERLP